MENDPNAGGDSKPTTSSSVKTSSGSVPTNMEDYDECEEEDDEEEDGMEDSFMDLCREESGEQVSDVPSRPVTPHELVLINIPEDIQKNIGCVVGENLFVDRTWCMVAKYRLLRDLEMHIKESPFYFYKRNIKTYPEDELLIGYDPFGGNPGEFVLCLSVDGKDKVLSELNALREEYMDQIVDSKYVVAKPYRSAGSEKDVADMYYTSTRPRMNLEWITKLSLRNTEEPNFQDLDAGANRMTFNSIHFKAKEPPKFIHRTVNEFGTQTHQPKRTSESQTEPQIPTNASVQCDPYVEVNEEAKVQATAFSPEKLDEFMNKFKEFLLSQLHYNAVYDLYRDEYPQLSGKGEELQLPPRDNYEHYQSFTDVVAIDGKTISSVSWSTKYSGVFAIAYANNVANQLHCLESDSNDSEYEEEKTDPESLKLSSSSSNESDTWVEDKKEKKNISDVDDNQVQENDIDHKRAQAKLKQMQLIRVIQELQIRDMKRRAAAQKTYEATLRRKAKKLVYVLKPGQPYPGPAERKNIRKKLRFKMQKKYLMDYMKRKRDKIFNMINQEMHEHNMIEKLERIRGFMKSSTENWLNKKREEFLEKSYKERKLEREKDRLKRKLMKERRLKEKLDKLQILKEKEAEMLKQKDIRKTKQEIMIMKRLEKLEEKDRLRLERLEAKSVEIKQKREEKRLLKEKRRKKKRVKEKQSSDDIEVEEKVGDDQGFDSSETGAGFDGKKGKGKGKGKKKEKDKEPKSNDKKGKESVSNKKQKGKKGKNKGAVASEDKTSGGITEEGTMGSEEQKIDINIDIYEDDLLAEQTGSDTEPEKMASKKIVPTVPAYLRDNPQYATLTPEEIEELLILRELKATYYVDKMKIAGINKNILKLEINKQATENMIAKELERTRNFREKLNHFVDRIKKKHADLSTLHDSLEMINIKIKILKKKYLLLSEDDVADEIKMATEETCLQKLDEYRKERNKMVGKLKQVKVLMARNQLINSYIRNFKTKVNGLKIRKMIINDAINTLRERLLILNEEMKETKEKFQEILSFGLDEESDEHVEEEYLEDEDDYEEEEEQSEEISDDEIEEEEVEELEDEIENEEVEELEDFEKQDNVLEIEVMEQKQKVVNDEIEEEILREGESIIDEYEDMEEEREWEDYEDFKENVSHEEMEEHVDIEDEVSSAIPCKSKKKSKDNVLRFKSKIKHFMTSVENYYRMTQTKVKHTKYKYVLYKSTITEQDCEDSSSDKPDDKPINGIDTYKAGKKPSIFTILPKKSQKEKPNFLAITAKPKVDLATELGIRNKVARLTKYDIYRSKERLKQRIYERGRTKEVFGRQRKRLVPCITTADDETESVRAIWGPSHNFVCDDNMRGVIRRIHKHHKRSNSLFKKIRPLLKTIIWPDTKVMMNTSSDEEGEIKSNRSSRQYSSPSSVHVSLNSVEDRGGGERTQRRSTVMTTTSESMPKTRPRNPNRTTMKMDNNITEYYDELMDMVAYKEIKEQLPELCPNNPVLVWGIDDDLQPKLRLDSPFEVTNIQFCPENGDLLAGCLAGGQVVLWDLSGKIEKVETPEILSPEEERHRKALAELMNWRKDIRSTRRVQVTAISNRLESHTEAATSLRWLHPCLKMQPNGTIRPVEEGEEMSHQFATTSESGTIFFWDINTTCVKTKNKKKSLLNHPDRLTQDESPYSILNNTWSPLFVVRCFNNLPVPLLGLTLSSAPTMYERLTPKIPGHQDKLEDRIEYKPTYSKVIESDSSTLFFCTLTGLVGSLTMNLQEKEEFSKIIPSTLTFFPPIHDGPVTSIFRNPFVDELSLTSGGHVWAIWHSRCPDHPILWKRYSVRVTGCFWSSLRPSLFRIARSDGSVEIWDLLRQSHKPQREIVVSGQTVTALSGPTLPLPRGILAVGDNYGAFRMFFIPWQYQVWTEDELVKFKEMVHREPMRLERLHEWRVWYREKFGNNKKLEHKDIEEKTKNEEQEKQKDEETRKKYNEEVFKWYMRRRGKQYTFEEEAEEKWNEKQKLHMLEVVMSMKKIDRKQMQKLIQPLEKKERHERERQEKVKERLKEADLLFRQAVSKILPKPSEVVHESLEDTEFMATIMAKVETMFGPEAEHLQEEMLRSIHEHEYKVKITLGNLMEKYGRLRQAFHKPAYARKKAIRWLRKKLLKTLVEEGNPILIRKSKEELYEIKKRQLREKKLSVLKEMYGEYYTPDWDTGKRITRMEEKKLLLSKQQIGSVEDLIKKEEGVEVLKEIEQIEDEESAKSIFAEKTEEIEEESMFESESRDVLDVISDVIKEAGKRPRFIGPVPEDFDIDTDLLITESQSDLLPILPSPSGLSNISLKVDSQVSMSILEQQVEIDPTPHGFTAQTVAANARRQKPPKEKVVSQMSVDEDGSRTSAEYRGESEGGGSEEEGIEDLGFEVSGENEEELSEELLEEQSQDEEPESNIDDSTEDNPQKITEVVSKQPSTSLHQSFDIIEGADSKKPSLLRLDSKTKGSVRDVTQTSSATQPEREDLVKSDQEEDSHRLDELD